MTSAAGPVAVRAAATRPGGAHVGAALPRPQGRSGPWDAAIALKLGAGMFLALAVPAALAVLDVLTRRWPHPPP